MELIIGIFLIGACALPLARISSKAVREEIKSIYRMDFQRLGDLAFAQFKAKLYKQEIPWDALASSKNTQIFNDEVVLALQKNPLSKETDLIKLKRKASYRSVWKKGKHGEEWRLVTFQVYFYSPRSNWLNRGTKIKKKTALRLSYQVLVSKLPSAPIPPQTA
jgi:hypothetical protein